MNLRTTCTKSSGPRWKTILTILALLLLAFSTTWQLRTKQSAERSLQSQPDRQTRIEVASETVRNQKAIGDTMTSQEAVSIALNRISGSPGGLKVEHPRHRATFNQDGLTFTPKTGGPSWHWQLQDLNSPPVQPRQNSTTIEYRRGNITEQYIPRTHSIEQRFVLKERPAHQDDLVIRGQVDCEGDLESHAAGWLWRGENGKVTSLGGVKVFDALGQVLPATMSVTRNSTEIIVDGSALAMADYPVTVDPEIGTNDFKISASLDNYAKHFDAITPDVVFNSTHNEFFVVWLADGTAGHQEEFEYEVIGQRLDATTGALLGTTQIVISTTFEDGETNEGRPANPAVAYNPADDQYLVVWLDDRLQISGQLLDGVDGSEIGTDFEISDLGSGSSRNPDIAFSTLQNQYLVVWHGATTDGGLHFGETEIYGQLIDRLGNEVGSDDFRISNMGTDGDSAIDATLPAVAYNSIDDLFLVVWQSDNDVNGILNGEFEIFGQLLNGETGAEVGSNDFRISDMGINGSTGSDASAPDVAHDPINNQFLVVWHGDDSTPPIVNDETEIFGQLLSGDLGQEIGTNDFRISQFGNDDGNPDDFAEEPSVCFVAGEGSYVVSWLAHEQLSGEGDRETEVFAQVIAAANGNAIGSNIPLSDMGPEGDPLYSPKTPAVASDGGSKIAVLWSGDDDRFGLLEDEHEIFGQLALVSDSGISETQANDFRISEAGNDGDNISDTFLPAVAYNSVNNNYLVVWEQNALGSSGSEEHIAGNRIDASSGARLHEDDFLVSQSTSGGSIKENYEPALTYNPTHNEFLVVYSGNSRADDEFSGIETEIFVRRMSGETGAFASDEFRISAMGLPRNSRSLPRHAACAYNAMNDQYLVVWESDDNEVLLDNKYEIWGQRLNGLDAQPLGEDDFRISFTQSDSDADRDATRPSIAEAGNTYLVAWQADGGTTDDKYEIYAIQIAADTGLPLGTVTKISSTGSNSNILLNAENCTVAADPGTGDFLIAWQADKSSDDDFQIYGEFVRAGEGLTPSDFAISTTAGFVGINPAASFNPVSNEFVVAWESLPVDIEGREEIRAQRINPTDGEGIGDPDFLLSDMGPEGDDAFGAHTPGIAINSSNGSVLTVWSGDDHENGRIDDEFEIFGQLFSDISEITITAIEISGDDVIVRFMSLDGAIYSLQESINLNAWTDSEVAQVTGTGGLAEFVIPNGVVESNRRFFRVIR